MFKEVTKISAFILIAGLISCGNNKSENQIQAEELLSQAQNQFNDGSYDMAIETIDSLSKKFAGVLDVQRNAMHLKTLIIEKKTIQDSIANDAIIDKYRQAVDSLEKNFKYIKTKDMVEGYWVSKKVSDNNLVKQTNIEARIDEMGNIYLITSLYGQSINYTSITAKANGLSVSSKSVPTSNSNNYRYKDGGINVEMVTFTNANCDSICKFINDNKANISITFNGKKSLPVKLSAKSLNTISETYEYATKKATLKKAEDLKLYYSKKLQITRKQVRSTATNINGDSE